MKDNDTLRNILIAGGIFLLVMSIAPRVIKLPPPRPTTAEQQTTPVAATGPTDRPTTGPSAGATGVQPTPTDETAGDLTVVEADQPAERTMGSEAFHENGYKAADSPFRMRLVLSSVGASVDSATVTDHAETLDSDRRYRLLAPIERERGPVFRSLAIDKVNVDGDDVTLFDKVWHAGEVTDTGDGQRIEFWIEIHKQGRAAIKLTRRFELPRQPQGAGRHDLLTDIRVDNIGPEPHEVIVTYLGGLGIRRTAGSRMDDRVVDCGVYDGTRVAGTRHRAAQVHAKGDALTLYAPVPTEPISRLSWAATANTYFTCTLAPRTLDGKDNPAYIADVSAVDLDRDKVTDDDITVRFVTGRRALAPDESITYPADVFLGEKDAKAFRAVPAYMSRNYYYQIEQGFGWCTFSFLVELMIWLLNGLHLIVRDFGVAIIILVLIVRVLLHPITKKGQVNMVRMQQKMGDIAPKLEEIKRKYANDKVQLQQEQMKIYREAEINPAGNVMSCLPTALQMPIWFALYLSLSNNILLRHQGFLFTWIHDLTAPDALYTFQTALVVPVLGWTIPALNLLPILVSVFMFTQQKFQPKPKPSPNMSDQKRQQQEMMQKMAPMMSIMMLFIFYKMPSGLNLYIMCSSLFGTIEQVRIRKHIKEQEEAGTLHKNAKKTAPSPTEPAKRAKPSFFERMQKMADQAQKTQATRHRPRKSKPRR